MASAYPLQTCPASRQKSEKQDFCIVFRVGAFQSAPEKAKNCVKIVLLSAFCQRPHTGKLSFFLLAAFDLSAPLLSAISSA